MGRVFEPSAKLEKKNLTLWGTRLFVFFIAMEALLVVLDVLFAYGRLLDFPQVRRFCNMAREDGIGTYVSVVQLFLVGQLALAIALVTRLSLPESRNWVSWSAVAGLFFFMSLDDASQLHERVGSVVKILLEEGSPSRLSSGLSTTLQSYPSYTWQLSIGPFYVIAGMLLFYFLWQESDTHSMKKLSIAGFSCFALALTLDFVEGIDGGHRWIEELFTASPYTVRHFGKVIEETLELTGTSFFLLAFARNLANRIATVDFHFTRCV